LSGSQATGACAKTGTFTVGPTGTYSTFTGVTGAIADLTNNGLAGPVVLEIQTTYTGAGEVFPITIGLLPCISATNYLKIRPQGTVSITQTIRTPFLIWWGPNL
jgi:hypothetical protein